MIRLPAVLLRPRLSVQFAAWMFVASLVPLGAIFVTYRIAREEIHQRALVQMTAISDNHANAIENYAEGRIRDVTGTGLNSLIAGIMAEHSGNPLPAGKRDSVHSELDRRIGPFLADQVQMKGYGDCLLIDLQGEVHFVLKQKSLLGTNLPDGPLRNSPLARIFSEALTLLEIGISDFEVFSPAGRPAAFVAAPLLHEGVATGVLALEFDNQDIYATVNDLTGLGETGEIIIASRVGDRALFLAPTRHDPQAAFQRSVLLEEDHSGVRLAVLGNRGVGLFDDYRGRKVYAAWQYLPSFRWGMVTKIDADEVLAPLANMRRLGLYSALICLALVTVIALILAQSILLPLEELVKGTDRIRTQDFSARLPEEGPPEIVTLSKALNRAADELQRSYTLLRKEIAEHQQSEKNLREQKEQHTLILQTAMDGFLRLDCQGRLLEANRAYCLMSGYSMEELRTLQLSDMEDTESPLETQRHAQRIIDLEEDFFETRHRRKDGSIYDVEVSVQFKASEGGWFAAFIRDISKRKRAEESREKLEAVNRQLQKSDSLNRMAGAIAHHFNNKLQAVSLSLEMAIEELAAPRGTPQEFLQEATRAAHEASEVSSLMLTYLGQSHPECRRISLSEVCQKSLPILLAALPKNVVLKTDFPAEGPFILSNANQIQQVLTNLVTNAWEAVAGRQGFLSIRVATVPSSAIHPSRLFPPESAVSAPFYACLEVKDSGCGMEEAEMDRIFDPFYSSKFPGRGMGLAVVIGIVRSHEGMVAVESRPELGSAFRVYFPLAEAPPAQKDQDKADIVPLTDAGAMLLVEDDDMVKESTETMLRHLGFTIFSTRNGEEAVEVFRLHSQSIRWVLCDLEMPIMDGWDTMAALRQMAPGIPFILSSGYPPDGNDGEGRVEQPQAFLRKPFGCDQLLAAFRSIGPF